MKKIEFNNSKKKKQITICTILQSLEATLSLKCLKHSLYSFQTKTRFFTEIQLYISLKILIFIFERVTSQNKI